ncbi:carboxymuconolactone decarboxylase family protein [Actinacidiphila bryophytorum]|uniref:4-carboxymuconolactone decarboxylase domain/alkylhydroperoxidase AhpD family core domain protein n=1 Tax=Actinacidiphila bryophytorum TaxID=1436133 RepID=A0A9W4MJD0_9ACTN|nr:carboxymuconolactone decarboxylase family protein [Actinacidiphila bryophytorum]MBM9435656.1 carboxymuconolactone decarboxylase family protein [Actinacidiphila bryophytorum]MBN6547203.1 carboxymuconolactone decarboxylase family protein [Actinacidiphila bryophytorum]UWE13453.1 carboxymuconolactone decarboxylase family protein [Actinacidiphila bryophytorum]CAG7650894.1 4-carboxymuconolactone decarboxylase domain/alkylhydroperoxidase AhpD family core domain protein [Actinacidiphila bryophytorum
MTTTTDAAETTTADRIDIATAAPKVFKALIGFDAASRAGLDPTLVELVQTRASQINGCAYCLHMHTKDARRRGETEERLYLLSAWREARHFYTAKEQAALAFTEAVTLVAQAGVPDDVYDEAAAHFDDAELAQLLGLVLTINAWNRIALTSRRRAGTDARAAAH